MAKLLLFFYANPDAKNSQASQACVTADHQLHGPASYVHALSIDIMPISCRQSS